MSLTDKICRTATSAERLLKLSDGGGLQLWIMPTGSKLWRLAYRFQRKQKLLAIGPYPLISLSKAREARDDAKRLLLAGTDPSDVKRESKLQKDTFDRLAEDYLAKLKRERRSQATLSKNLWLFALAAPTLGSRPIRDIAAREILEVLQKLEAKGQFETAQRLRSTIGSAFRFAIASDRADRDPTYALKGALARAAVTHRPAITNASEFGGLIRAINGYSGHPSTRAALRLMALLFPRPGELRQAEWPEFELEALTWTIPAERAKMRRAHKLPISTQARDTLVGLQRLSPAGRLILPALRGVDRPMSENTLNAALRALGYSSGQATAHGFRASASTLLNESNRWSADGVERQLGHVEKNDIRRAYARGEHWDERRAMIQWWADYIDGLAAS